jgi:hypothetical protein
LTLAGDAFDDRPIGVAWSGAEVERCMSRSITQAREEAQLADDRPARNNGALAQLAAMERRQVGYKTVL